MQNEEAERGVADVKEREFKNYSWIILYAGNRQVKGIREKAKVILLVAMFRKTPGYRRLS